MATASSRTLRNNAGGEGLTVGDMVAAFYDEAHRAVTDDTEADRLARASLMHAMRWRYVRGSKRAG